MSACCDTCLECDAAKCIYIDVGFWMTLPYTSSSPYMGVIMFGMSGLDGAVAGCTGAFTFFGRGKLVVLPLKALMLMVSFAEASSDEKVGFKSIVYWLYHNATFYLNHFIDLVFKLRECTFTYRFIIICDDSKCITSCTRVGENATMTMPKF